MNEARAEYEANKAEISKAVIAEIKTTNNKKLLRVNVPNNLKKFVNFLVEDGYVKNAYFLSYGDSIAI